MLKEIDTLETRIGYLKVTPPQSLSDCDGLWDDDSREMKHSFKVNRASSISSLRFPHDMQTNNSRLIEKEAYKLMDGDAAIYLPECPAIDFKQMIYKKVDYFNMGKRLMGLGHRIWICNPHFTAEQLFDCLYYYFLNFVEVPERDRDRISKWKKYGDNFRKDFAKANQEFIINTAIKVSSSAFKSSIPTKSKVVFNPDYNLTAVEKQQVSAELMAQVKKGDTVNRLIHVVQSIKGKVTQKAVAIESGMGIATIKRYWKQIKPTPILT